MPTAANPRKDAARAEFSSCQTIPPPLENPAAYARPGSARTTGTLADPVAKSRPASSASSSSTNTRSSRGNPVFRAEKCTHSSSISGSVSGKTSR